MANLNGGIIGTSNTPTANKITTFNSSGTLSTSSGTTEAEYLVIAGGGGTGNTGAGGGGAGGYRTGTLSVRASTDYSITVGAGGAGGDTGSNGNNSVFTADLATITSTYGAGATGFQSAGVDGGSGSGAGARCNDVGGDGNTPATTPSQGNDGGDAEHTGIAAGGGGGGAGAVGGDDRDTTSGEFKDGGNGGAGLASSITGTSVTRAGGGGAGQDNGGEKGDGGAGGGGDGTDSSNASTAGTANTGGGGGGGGNPGPSDNAQGAAGGSGVVIISENSGGVTVANGGWDMQAVYTYVKAGVWA